MSREDFNNLLRLMPFRPFRLILTSGAAHEIRHPEFAIASKTVVWIHSLDGTAIVVSLLHIEYVEFLDDRPIA